MEVTCPKCGTLNFTSETEFDCCSCGTTITTNSMNLNGECSLAMLIFIIIAPGLLLWLFGEWLASFSLGTYSAIFSLDNDFCIWLIALHLGLFILPILWFFLAAYFMPILVTTIICGLIGNPIIIIIGVLGSCIMTPTYIRFISPSLRRAVFWVWTRIGILIFRNDENCEEKGEKFAVLGLILVLAVIPITLFIIANQCGHDFMKVISTLTA